MADSQRQRLESGLAELACTIDSERIDLLLAYLHLMMRWNKAFNLTAIRDPREMVVRHLLDSLAINDLIKERRLIDVGTGPGLPGVPLAIVEPQRHISLLDSNGKKSRFLFQVKTQLGLTNIDILNSRVENYSPDRLFEGVVSRAFTRLSNMVSTCRHLLGDNGRLYAMKGSDVQAELDELADDVHIIACHDVRVPGLDEPRYVVELAVKRSQSKG